MIVKKKVMLPAREVEEVDYHVCDLCGLKTSGGPVCVWSDLQCHGHEITIEHTVDCLGDPVVTVYRADVCPECFETKVVPALTALGTHANPCMDPCMAAPADPEKPKGPR